VSGTGWWTLGRAKQSVTTIIPVWQYGHSPQWLPGQCLEPVSDFIGSDSGDDGAYGTSRRLPACILAGVRWLKAMV
jgi:hypothetical protein